MDYIADVVYSLCVVCRFIGVEMSPRCGVLDSRCTLGME